MNNDTDRAKQFLAFAALSGFERLLKEQEQALQHEEERKQAKFDAQDGAFWPEDGEAPADSLGYTNLNRKKLFINNLKNSGNSC